MALVLFSVVFTLFSQAIGYDFINYDDSRYVFANPHVLRGLSWEGMLYAFSTLDGVCWTPTTWISYMLDTSLYGSQPAGYHLTNILLHSASTAVLFLTIQRMTGRLWAAAAVAALFALHPQRLESVAWIAERKDVLSVFFGMTGLLAYLRYAEHPSLRRMMWVYASFMCALMAKPMLVSFPFILILLDFWPLRRAGRSNVELCSKMLPLLKEKSLLFVMCAVAGGVTIWSQWIDGAIVPVHFPWYLKILQLIENVGFYCKSFLMPKGCSIVYPVEHLDYMYLFFMGSALMVISLLALRQLWRWPWLAVGWLWFLLALAPVAGIFRLGHIAVADRYSYLPSAGLAFVVVFAIIEAISYWPHSRSLFVSGLASWIFFCVLMTWADLPRWKNTYSVFESAYRNGHHFIACDQLGSLLYANQEYQQSVVVCTRGLDVNPQFASLYNTRGGDYYMLGDLNRALADFNQAILVNPAFSPAYYSRALVYIQRKKFDEAKADIKTYTSYGGQLDSSWVNIQTK